MNNEIQQNPKLTETGNTLLEQSKALMVPDKEMGGAYILKDETQREIAGILLKEASLFEKKINAHYKPIEESHKKHGEQIKAAKERQISIFRQVKKILSLGIGAFDAKKRREAEEKARLERERIEKERLAEAQRKAEEAQKLKEAGEELAAKELEEEAENILDLPEPVVTVETPIKIEGTKTTTYVKCKIVDPGMCLDYIISQIKKGESGYARFLNVNESEIRRYIKENGTLIFPGVRIWTETQTSVTGR